MCHGPHGSGYSWMSSTLWSESPLVLGLIHSIIHKKGWGRNSGQRHILLNAYLRFGKDRFRFCLKSQRTGSGSGLDTPMSGWTVGDEHWCKFWDNDKRLPQDNCSVLFQHFDLAPISTLSTFLTLTYPSPSSSFSGISFDKNVSKESTSPSSAARTSEAPTMEGGRTSLKGTPPLARRGTAPPLLERPRTVWRKELPDNIRWTPDGTRRRTLAKAGSIP